MKSISPPQAEQQRLLSPQGQVVFVHRRLPMGKKDKTLCVLCDSAVSIPLKIRHRNYELERLEYG